MDTPRPRNAQARDQRVVTSPRIAEAVALRQAQWNALWTRLRDASEEDIESSQESGRVRGTTA
jgi:hypothetical protein